MQGNEKIIMNPPTVFRHLANSLTQSIRSNEPQLIFTRDKEIGSLQPAPFHFSSVDLPVSKSTWKIAVRGQNKSRRAHESMKVSESKGQSGGEKRRARQKRGVGNYKGKKGGGGESTAAVLICLPTKCYCSADCFINPVSLHVRWRNCEQEDRWAEHARNNATRRSVLWKEENEAEGAILSWGSYRLVSWTPALSQQATGYSMWLWQLGWAGKS